MSSVLACPTAASTAPWSLFMSAALEAWKQWIQVVHAGQAQFQDWCEYVLETTIDQLIESVSLGLALLGVENPSADRFLEDQQRSALSLPSSFNKTKRIRSQSRDREQIYKRQKRMSGLHRAGKLLQGYPSLQGAVRCFGNSWLGLKIRSRLEQKMEIVADQVVDWWEGDKEPEEEEEEKKEEEDSAHNCAALSLSSAGSKNADSSSWSPSPPLSGSTMTEMEVSGPEEDEGSLELAMTDQAAKAPLATTVN
ncbi:hypothetical protein BGZ72_008817 [Mortierella alpina]|nr:hypothetical protein BGZ72_008817 [Mortierella alpina]